MSKWMGRGCNKKQQSIQEWTLNLNWSDKKEKTRNRLGCFENVSDFSTRFFFVFFFPDLSLAYNMVRVIEKLYRNDLKGNKNYFELARVRITEG